MEELITRITSRVGIDKDRARQAVSIILSFLSEEGPKEKVRDLAGRIGAAEYVHEEDRSAATLGGLMGGGLMAVAGRLQALGLSVSEIQGVTQETIGYARERGGADLIDEIVASIPGLSQFV